MFSFWSHTYTQMKPKISCEENLPPSGSDKQLHDTETVDLPSLTEKKILTDERFDNYAITKLSN